MIQNQRQYNATKAQIARLEDALQASRAAKERMPARVYKAMVAGIRSQIDEMQAELSEYDELASSAELHLGSVDDLPAALIKARIARGYTQKELAEKLDIKPQQIQRYEASGYRAASLERVLRIMRALDLELEADLVLKPDS